MAGLGKTRGANSYGKKPKPEAPPPPSSAERHEHEGRTPQPGIPAGPRDTEHKSASGYEYSPQTYAETGLTPPGSSARSAHEEARHEAQEARRQEQVEARQTRLVNRFVTQAYKPPKQPSTKGSSSGPAPGGIFAKTSQATAKAKSNVSDLREKLLSHPAVQKANAEGKVVGAKGLRKIAQHQSGQPKRQLGPPTPKVSKPASNPLALKGPLTHVVKQNPNNPLIEKPRDEFGLGDIGSAISSVASGAKNLYEGIREQENPNPIGKFAEEEAKKAYDTVKQRQQWVLEGTSQFHPPTAEEAELLANIATGVEGGSAVVKGAGTGLEVAGNVAGKLSTKEGAKELGAAALQKGAKVVEGAKGAARVPGQVVEGVKGAGAAAREAVPKALKATPEALRSSPEYLGKGARAIPGFAGKGAVSAGRFAAEGGAKSAHNFAVLGALGATNKATGVDVPGLEPLKRAGAIFEGTKNATLNNFGQTLATTGRSLPGLVTAPAAVVEAGAESIEHGTPKPLENTLGAIKKGTLEMGEKFLSGDPKVVQESVENEVGYSPFTPVPSFLAKLHGSHVYEGGRGAVRKAVENRRDTKRTKAEAAATGARYKKAKQPAAPVPVSSRPGEHYVIPGWGKRIESGKAKRDVALDTTRASSRAAMEGKLVSQGVVGALRGKTGPSLLAKGMGPEYEAAAWPFAKYGIPHTDKGRELAKALSEYFPEPKVPVPGSLTDRMAVNAAVENPSIFSDRRHAAGTEKIREAQRELAHLRGKNDVAPHRIQNDFTNYLSGKEGLAPVLKDYERISERAHQFTSPEEAAAALRGRTADLNTKAATAEGDSNGVRVTDVEPRRSRSTTPGLEQFRGVSDSRLPFEFNEKTGELRLGKRGYSHAEMGWERTAGDPNWKQGEINLADPNRPVFGFGGKVLSKSQRAALSALREHTGLDIRTLDQWHNGQTPATGSATSAVKRSSAKRKAETLRGEAAKAAEHAEVIEKGGVVSREGAWAHYDALNHEYETTRKAAQKKRAQAQTAPASRARTLRDEAKTLSDQAGALAKQKKGLYSELKGYTKPTAVRDASKLPVSSRAMKEAFRREQAARAKHFGLDEPVYVADTKPTVPGEPGVAIERPFPTRAQHFKEGVLSRSGEANARFESSLLNSAVNPRTRMAINELVHNTVNERKLPVKVRGKYKHVLTQAEEEWAKRHGTWPANAAALDSGLVKQGLVGVHSLDGEAVGHLLSVAERAGEDAPEALRALAATYPDIKDELLAAADQKGRKVIAVERTAIQELKDQFAKPAHPGWRTAANLPTRVLLNDPAWVFAQLFATATPIAFSLGPSALLHAPLAIKAMADIQKRPIADQARIASMVGSSVGVFGTPESAFKAAHDPLSGKRAIRSSRVGRKAWELVNGELMSKWDRWNSSKMREYSAAIRASKGFRNWAYGFKGLNKGMEEIARRTKGMGTAERLDYISRHPELARNLQKDINRMGGNWNSFTALERKIAPFTIFYPWLRYSIDFTFHVFPLNHPVAASMLNVLAQRNSNELQKLAAAKAQELGLKGFSDSEHLSDVMAYANPVHRNAADEPVENPRGTRFSPSLGVFGELVSSGNLLKGLSALNPEVATVFSLAANKNLFTGQELEGSLLENLGEQVGSMIPGFRGAEAATGYRGFTKMGNPQSAVSKAYEMLAGGKRQKTERSLLNPYLTRPASAGAMEADLNKIEERIGATGKTVQSKVANNLWQTSAKNKREIKKLVAKNKKAYTEREVLLKTIDPSGKLAQQSKGEYEHYVNSLPSLFESSGTSGLPFGNSGGSSSSTLPFGNTGSSSSSTPAFGPKTETTKPEYKPPKEEVHLPNVGGAVEGFLNLLGGGKAEAAELPFGKRGQGGKAQSGVAAKLERTRPGAAATLNQGEAKKLLESQGASPGVAARISAEPQARAQLASATSAGFGNQPTQKVEATTEDILRHPNKRVTHFGNLPVLGKVPVKAIMQAAKNGTLKEDGHGRLTIPATRQAQKRYEKAKTAYDESGVSKIAPLSSGGGSTQFAQWFAHYSHLHPQVAAAWVLAEGAGEGGTTGGEAGRNNWLAAGYPAQKTPFSEAPYFNGSPKRAAKATAEWMEGKIGGEYGYPVSSGIAKAFGQFKGKTPQQQIELIASSGWVDGHEALNSSYYDSIANNASQVQVLSKGGAPRQTRERLKVAERNVKKLGVDPGELDSGQRGPVTIAGKGRYVFPFSKGWETSRTDMGKDYAYTEPGAPIRALGAGTIVEPAAGEQHWEGGQAVLEKLTNAKGLPSPYVYTYEGIEPTVKPGQKVGRGQVIGKGGITGSIETGFANAAGEPLAAGEYSEGAETKAGQAMSNLLEGLAKGKTKIPARLLDVGGTTGGSTYTTPSGALTPAAVTTYAQATGTPVKTVAKELKSKKLKPVSILERLRQVEQIYQGVIPGFGSGTATSPIPGFNGTTTSSVPTIDLAAIGATIAKERERLKPNRTGALA